MSALSTLRDVSDTLVARATTQADRHQVKQLDAVIETVAALIESHMERTAELIEAARPVIRDVAPRCWR